MFDIETLVEEAKKAIKEAKDPSSIEHLRVKYLGKKSTLIAALKNLGSLPHEDRIKVGQATNLAKKEITQLIKEQKQVFSDLQLEEKLKSQFIDITLPGRGQDIGSSHPVTNVFKRIENLFLSMGFDVHEGPEIEDEFHNFEALNIPKHHPAREASDTFYLENSSYLLRTQTSPVQIRAMETLEIPLRIIAPGKVYRCDYDSTHTPMFHQVEGLLVDKHVTFAELKGLLNDFLNNFFEKEVEFRFRPSYFPFTEPSAEIDIKMSKEGNWLEIAGCGMVHPNVFEEVKIDSERYSGFAFAFGVDRLAMLYYGITDLRMLFENDMKFLEQFNEVQ